MMRFSCLLFWSMLLLFAGFNPVVAQDSVPPDAAQEEETEAPTPNPVRPVPTVLTQDAYTLERYFGALQQGQVGVLRLEGEGIQEARALFRSEEYHFIPTEDGWYSLLVADIDAQPRDYPLAVVLLLDDGSTRSFDALVTIESSGFIRQLFEVPGTLAYLTDPVVERDEFAQIEAVTRTVTPEALWQGEGWQLPIEANYTSGFGQYRILNQTVQTRHTGWDQRAFVGTPVAAMANGTVVFAEQLAIRGNYVLIDHGWGIYTGYAHLSQINVQRGQSVTRGQIIGASGNTGRSNGPHLHWEIKVNGEWIDGALFLDTWLPYLD